MSLYLELATRLREGEFNYAFSISLKHKYVYVENAKAACTTVKAVLGELEFSDCDLGLEIPGTFFANVHVNVLGTPFVKPFQLGEQLFNEVMRSSDYFRFSFVRNPYSRLLSAYLDKIVRRRTEADQILEEALALGVSASSDDEISFRDFLRCIASITSRSGFLDKHWRPQYFQLHPDAVRYDFIGRVETFQQDIARVAALFGSTVSDERRTHGHETGAQTLLEKYYGDEEQALLLELYHSDFAHFGYDTELPVRD